MNINNITIINNIIDNRKIVHLTIYSWFFFHIIDGKKSFELFPKHSGYGFISSFFRIF